MKKNIEEMSFLDHLEELRWHLIRMTLAVVIGGAVAFLLKSIIFDVILFGPKDPNFWTYRQLCHLSQFFGLDESFCITEFPFRLQSRQMSGQFSAHLWTSITAGFIIAFPYLLYEIWKFISPALYDTERKYARVFIFVSSVLFFIGVVFGYYIITPLSINFLTTYTVSNQVFNDIDLSSYIGLLRASVIASGLIFELPVLIYFLAKLGLVTPEFLRKYRKFALILILFVSAIITPPDIASQVIVAIPVLILYEISIYIAKFVVKKENIKNLPHV